MLMRLLDAIAALETDADLSVLVADNDAKAMPAWISAIQSNIIAGR